MVDYNVTSPIIIEFLKIFNIMFIIVLKFKLKNSNVFIVFGWVWSFSVHPKINK
jgi:hypothetical protein